MMKRFLILFGAVAVAIFTVNYLVFAFFSEPTAPPPGDNTPPPVINLFVNCRGGCIEDQTTGLRWDAVNRTPAVWTAAGINCKRQGARLPSLTELLDHNITAAGNRWTDQISFERAEKTGIFSSGSTDVFWVFAANGTRFGVNNPQTPEPYLCVSGL